MAMHTQRKQCTLGERAEETCERALGEVVEACRVPGLPEGELALRNVRYHTNDDRR